MTISEEGGNSNKHGLFQQLFRRSKTSNSDQHDAVTITTNNTTSSSLGNTITNRRTKRNTTQQQKQQQQTATTQIMRQRPRNQNEFDRNPTTASAPNQRLPNMMSYSASNSYDNYHRHNNHHLQTSPNKGGIPTRPKLRQHQPSFDNDMSSHPNTTSTAATVQYGIQHRQQEMNSTTSSHPTPGNDMFCNNHSSSKWQQGESFQHHYPAMNNDPNNQYQHQRPSIPPQQGHNHSSSFLVLNNDHSSPTTSWQQAATASQGYYLPQQQHQPPPPPLGYYDSFYHQVNSLNNGQGYQNHPQQQTQQPYRANRPQSQLWSTQGMQTQHSTTTTQRVIKQGQTAEQQQQRSQSQPRQTQPFHRNSAVGALSVSSSPLGGTTQMLLGLQKQSRGNGNGDSSISSAPIISGGGYETTGQRPRTSRNDHTREQYLMYSKSNNNNNNNNPHPYYQQAQNWMPNLQQSLQLCSLANTTKNKSDNNSSSNMQPPHLSQYLSNQDTGNSMDSLNTTLATTEISNQDTGNSMDSVNTTFATTENFPRGSYHHPQNKIESRSNSNHQHQRAFSMDETSGRNSVVVKPKGILKKSEAAPIQPIVYQSMMKDQRQRQQQLARRNPDLSLNTMASTALISNHQSNHLGTAVSEITQFTTGLQDEHDHGSNKANNPIDQLQGHNHNVSQRRHQQPQFDDIQQPPYPRQATKGSERSTNVAQHLNETHPVNYSMYDSSQQSAAPKDSNFQYTQGSQQLFAIPQLSHTHSLDNFSGPHTRTRQQRASSVGRADQYNELRSARPTASASQASYLRTKNPNISMDFSRDNRSIDIPNSNAMRLLQDDSETKSVLSSPSAFTRSTHATNTSKSHAVNQSPHSFASGSRNVYFTENGESKSFVSFTTSEASHPSRSGHTSQGGNNGSMLALALSTQVMQSFNFGKEQRTQGYAKTISMMSSEMAITRGSDVSHISSRAGKYRSASAPRVHQNADQDAKTVVSSGSILTKGSHLSSGSRHSSSLNISRHDDDDTRSVITNSSSRPPQNSYSAYDDYDGKSVATDTRSIRSSQTRGSVRSSSSNRSEHRPAPNAWDVDKGARARRASASGDGMNFQSPKTPAQKKKESIAIATELSDKVVSSLLSQQGLADSSFSYDTVVRKTPSQMEINSKSDLIVSSSAAGQVSADLKGHVLRVQMETLRHQLNDIISERNPDSSHVSIPPIPPFSDSYDKCIHANPLTDSSLETPTSAKPTTEISGAQDEVNTVKPTGHESPIKWTPVESISDCLSDSLSWSPPLSNPRAKKVTAIENGQHAEPSVKNVSSDTMEAKAVKKAKKKKTSKEGKSSKEKLPKKMKPDAVAKIANELKPAICCVTNEVGIHHHAGFSDTDDQSPEWTMTRRSGPAILPVNDRQEEMLPQKDKPVLMTDLRPDALEGGLSSHGTGKSMEFSEHAENQQLSKPAKSAKKKSKKKESKITCL